MVINKIISFSNSKTYPKKELPSQQKYNAVPTVTIQSKSQTSIANNDNDIPKAILLGCTALIAGGAIYYLTGKKANLSNKIYSAMPSWDISYKKDLLASIPDSLNINKNDTSILQSIMGKEELKNMLTKFNGMDNIFSQGQRTEKWVQDTNLMTNIENFTYRANLHIHTTHSDGKMSVQNLLDNAVKYADQVAQSKNKPFSEMPFTIAICDHDTINGCKEAVEIIAKNPEKYKNLRVLLGCELSTFHKDISSVLPQHRTHLLVYNINPYNDTLTKLLSQKQNRTLNTAQNIITKMNEKMHNYWDFKEINYTLEEAKKTNWCIRDGLNTVNSPLKDYFQFRKIYHETIKYNNALDKFLKENNIQKSSISFEDTCKNVTYIHKKLTDGEKMPYWNKYLISLKWELLKKIHGDDYTLTKQNYKQSLEEVNKYFTTSEKNLNNSMKTIENEFYPLIKSEEEQISDFTQTLKILSKDKNISLGIAHPAFISPYHFANNDIAKKNNFITDLFKIFKAEGGENALYYEKIYPYFNSDTYTKIDDEFLDYINKEATKHNLIPSGSLDNHGKNLFLTE